MEQNEPVTATDAIAVTASREPVPADLDEPVEIHGLRSGVTYYVGLRPRLGHRPPWWRANARDLWAWVGIGAGAVLIIEAIAVVVIGVAVSS